MQSESFNRNRVPQRLLHLCKDLNLIDDYVIDEQKVAIRQGLQTRQYSPAEAEEFLDAMLDAAPILKRIASDLPRLNYPRQEKPQS